jgi:hypothetical protein
MSSHARQNASLRLLPALLALAVLLAAAALRSHQFNAWPPGLSRDEALNAVDAYSLATTFSVPFYLSSGRPEPLYRFVQAITVGLIGPTRFGLRIASLYMGVLAVAAAYRAGRHFAPRGSRARRWAGLAAAGVLAVMVGHIHLSRLAYRAIPTPLAILLFADSFLAGVESGRTRHFALAGIWLAACAMTYTSGLMIVPAAALGALIYGVGELVKGWPPRDFIRRPAFKNLAVFALVFALGMGPMIALYLIQPELYGRAGEVNRFSLSSLINDPGRWLGRLLNTWEMVRRIGDINPQYNVASTPLLHTAPLYALLLAGIGGCLLRPRRLASWLALFLLFFSLLPVALAREVPHGLRIADMYGAIPLITAASAALPLWLAGRLKGRPLAQRGVTLGWIALVGGIVASAGWQSARIYADYFHSDVRWGDGEGVPAFSWFFSTRNLAVAEAIADYDGVSYLPLSAAGEPALRFFTLRSHPRVATFATYFDTDGGLTLPAGQVLLPSDIDSTATFAAFMPDGTLVLLPRFDADTLAQLADAAQAAGRPIYDAYGVLAATAVDFPPSGSTFHVEPIIEHTADVNYADRLYVVGWDGPLDLPAEGGRVEVTLYFRRGQARQPQRYLFTQLWDFDLQRAASGGQNLLHRYLYPPDRWTEEDIVPVVARLNLPDDLAPGAYTLYAGLLDHRFERLPVVGPNVTNAALVGRVRVARSEGVSLDNLAPLDVVFGDEIALLGYELADADGNPIERLEPGQTVRVRLVWEALRHPEADYTIFLHVHDGSETLAAQQDTQPDGGRYPTGIWEEGEIVQTDHLLTLPPDSGGPYTIYAGLYTWPSLERLPTRQNGQAVEDRRALLYADE